MHVRHDEALRHRDVLDAADLLVLADRGNVVGQLLADGPAVGIGRVLERLDVVRALAQRDLSVNALTERLNAVAVEFPMRNIGGQFIDPFFNINRQDDLANASALLSKPEKDKNNG